jgi:hypothetical protein
MGGNPDWIFYRDDKATDAEVMPRLVAEFPAFRPRWEGTLDSGKESPQEATTTLLSSLISL